MEKERFKINDRFSLQEVSGTIILTETTMKIDAEGKEKKSDKYRYYGTVYQALSSLIEIETAQGLNKCNSFEDIAAGARAALDEILSYSDQIKKNFRIEVKTYGGR